MSDYLDLGLDIDFVFSFESPEHFGDWLIDLHREYDLIDIIDIKQAFVNHNMDYYYMECVKFEEIYLKND